MTNQLNSKKDNKQNNPILNSKRTIKLPRNKYKKIYRSYGEIFIIVIEEQRKKVWVKE